MQEIFSFKICPKYPKASNLHSATLYKEREKSRESIKQKRMPNPWLLTLLCMHNALMHWLGAKPDDPILPTQVANQNTEFILLFPAISCHITIAVITVDPWYSCISNWVCQSEALQSTFQGSTLANWIPSFLGIPRNSQKFPIMQMTLANRIPSFLGISGNS